MGSVPIAIKPPIKAPTKPMLLVMPIKKNRKFETIIKIEKYNKDFFITNPEPRSLKVFSFVFIIPPFKIFLAWFIS